ncbi:MAG: hypothetical protein Q8936_17170 [Bacillota bacterium]|nr:hypothetical protein [Bacillota bacterium]
MNNGIYFDKFNSSLPSDFQQICHLELNRDTKKDIANIIKKIEEDALNSYEKGKILEDLIEKILLGTRIFKCIKNKHTQSNEFDILVYLNVNGRILRSRNIIPEWIPNLFLIECKNHKEPVEVGLVGKFYSLMDVSKINLGIFISRVGISGRGNAHWADAAAFVNKINLKYSESKPPRILLDLDLNEIKLVLEDDTNIIEIFENKKTQIDMDINSGILEWKKPHENEGKLNIQP